MGMPELVWWWAFLGNGTLRSNIIINKKECKYTYKLRYRLHNHKSLGVYLLHPASIGKLWQPILDLSRACTHLGNKDSLNSILLWVRVVLADQALKVHSLGLVSEWQTQP